MPADNNRNAFNDKGASYMKAAAILCSVIMLFSLPISVYADGKIKDIYDGLPNGVEELLPEDFENEVEKNDGTSAVKLLDAPFFLSILGKSLSFALSDTAPILLTLTVTVLLCALLSSLSKESTSVGKALSFASSVSLCGSCISIIKPLSEQCIGVINVLSGIIKTSLPILTSISLAGGQVNVSGANAAFLSAVLALTEEVSRRVLTPVLAVSVAFTAVSALSRGTGIDLSHMVTSVKKIFVFFISLLSTVLCITLAFQTVIAKGADTILLRSVKFASGSSIPIVGAALSEAAGTYLSGISLIKSSAGTLIAAAIALSTLPMLLKLFAVKLCLTFVAFVSDILGVNGATVRDFASVTDMLIAMLVTGSLIFVISMGVFASVLPSI